MCAAVFALLGVGFTASGWQANPQLGPHGLLPTIGAVIGVYGLWFFDSFVLLLLFAGVPWLLLRKIARRYFWIAPVAGFVVAFVIGFTVTTAPAHPAPQLSSSEWIDGKATMIDGQLTPYGNSRYGTAAGLENGVICGLFGAAAGFALVRLARRKKG